MKRGKDLKIITLYCKGSRKKKLQKFLMAGSLRQGNLKNTQTKKEYKFLYIFLTLLKICLTLSFVKLYKSSVANYKKSEIKTETDSKKHALYFGRDKKKSY